MMAGIFGWSYPPGAANDPSAPYNQTDEPIELAEDSTLKGGYGRRQHGLNGKDADLSSGGQNKVESALWFEDGRIEIKGYRYASLVPDEEWTEEQKNIAQELVCGCGYSGEWDGDYWVLSEHYTLKVSCQWNDRQSDKKNIERATKAAYKAIVKDSKAFEKEMAWLSEQFDKNLEYEEGE